MRRALLAILLAFPLMAAKAPAAECWFADDYLYAINIPIGIAFGITQDRVPTGGLNLVTDDGTWSGPTWVTSAYFWIRKGGGGGIFKPGPQLNDYKPIAHCVAGP
jgi:hypothetical protein